MNGDYFRLDSVTGWRAAISDHLIFAPADGALRLPPLAGRAKRVIPGGRPGLACVRALATDECGNLYLLDAGKNLVRRKRARDGWLESLPAIGDGRGLGGSEPRMLREPRGLALDAKGRLLIADTGNGRIQVFDPAQWTLTGVWQDFKQPWGVAAGKRWVFAAECGADRIAILDYDGRRVGEWSAPGMRRPMHLALGPAGVLAVIANGALWLFDAHGQATPLNDKEQFTAVLFDRLGRLHAATRNGVIHLLVRDANGAYQHMGGSFCGVAGRIEALAEWPPTRDPDPVQLLMAVMRDDNRRSTFWQASAEGACAQLGTFISKPLDSGIGQCAWHRIVLKGTVPDGSSVEITTQSWDIKSNRPPETDPLPAQPSYTIVGPASDPDCLVRSQEGQWLRFQLTFHSSGDESPQFEAIHVYFPRQSYLRHLPSVYQDDAESRAFLDRFLSLFQTAVEEENGAIDHIHRLLDPLTVPARFLQWLAAWVAFPLNPAWTEDYQRQQLAGAWQYYQMRGTKAGVEYAVKNFARVLFANVVEHYTLRHWPDSCCTSLEDPVPLWSPRIYSRWQVGIHSTVSELRLLDEPEPAAEPFAFDANKFTVFFPARDPVDAADTARTIAAVVEEEKPAHTEAVLCAVYPRFRVGVQSRVGVDSSVAEVTFMMLSGQGTPRISRLGYDTVLSPGEVQETIQRKGLAATPAAGRTTKLL